MCRNPPSYKFWILEEYAVETARKLVEDYPWYYLPPLVHKIRILGAEVTKHALVPVGELSKEAAEAKNKVIKQFRLQHTKKYRALLQIQIF